MHIFFSGIGGVGIGPLAEIAHDAGYSVSGSDREASVMTRQLSERGIPVSIGQSESAIAAVHEQNAIDLLVYTAALPTDHPELVFARERNIPTAKRDELLATIIKEKDLKLIAVAGTHGKTTTTGMFLWTLLKRGIPISYSIGAPLSWAPSGKFNPESQYFLYECDEFDRNFLHFHPSIALITSVDYDHADTYPTKKDYKEAFDQFMRQSDLVVCWDTDFTPNGLRADNDSPVQQMIHNIKKDTVSLDSIHLDGLHNRQNAYLVYATLTDHFKDPEDEILHLLETFPGTGRRFERLGDGHTLYSDYGHHPAEIAATLQLAKETALGSPVVLVYQPHQNSRQYDIRDHYTPEVFKDADEIYWLPTYLSREDPSLAVLTPEELTAHLADTAKVHIAAMDDALWQTIEAARADGKLVLIMGAGSVDDWARRQLAEQK